MSGLLKAAFVKLENAVCLVERRICGINPFLSVFDHQYLGVRYRRKRMEEILRGLEHKSVLDIGCGAQPYRRFLSPSCRYVGMDVYPSHPETVVVSPSEPWPSVGTFDVVLCTEVLEHVRDLPAFLKQIDRVLAPGGMLIATSPFLYMIHDTHDYRRLTLGEYANLFPYRLRSLDGYGRFGTVGVVLTLSWIYMEMHRSKLGIALYVLSLPLRLLVNLLFNMIGMLLDALDGTAAFYGGCFVVMIKSDTLPEP